MKTYTIILSQDDFNWHATIHDAEGRCTTNTAPSAETVLHLTASYLRWRRNHATQLKRELEERSTADPHHGLPIVWDLPRQDQQP